MTLEIGLVLAIVTIMVVCLIKEVARPDIIVFFTTAVFLLLGILTPAEALQGFSNEGMLTIALLFIVAGAIQQSGLLNQVVKKILGQSHHPRKALIRMMLPVSSLSAFMNNTPIVVMLMTDIRKWCDEHHISPSKFLLPLSYAAIFGGLITLMGTSTNLVVHGLMLESGMIGFSMFQLAVVGIPAAIVGIIYMSTVGFKLLPETKSLEETFNEDSREYLAEMTVQTDSPIIGKTIEQAGLRSLTGLYLIEIIREKESVTPVTSYEVIQAGDVLIFTGMVSTIVELQQIKGLRLETGSDLSLEHLNNGKVQLIEAVVSHNSFLVHKSIRQNNFRSRFDAAVVAVHRNHERIKSKVGDIILKPGDTLLLLVGHDFAKRWSQSNDFYVISPIEVPAIMEPKKSNIAILSLVGMVLLAALNVLTIFKAALVAVGVLLLTKTITPEDVKKFVHFNVLLLIASAFGIGVALDKTGAADLIASQIVHLADGISIIGLLLIIYLLTNIITEMITNSAAAVIMFPIAVSTAHLVGAEPMPFIITITIAATASFITPIGYQTNLIVYGPGGYKFTDYLKVGFPLTLLYMLLTVSIVSIVW
jgi:di/tricarboxylate transporter